MSRKEKRKLSAGVCGLTKKTAKRLPWLNVHSSKAKTIWHARILQAKNFLKGVTLQTPVVVLAVIPAQRIFIRTGMGPVA